MNKIESKRRKLPRVRVYIDGSNLYHGLEENLGRHDLDYKLFCEKVSGPDRRFIRAHFFMAFNEDNEAEMKFREHLKAMRGFLSVHEGRLAKRKRDHVCPLGGRYKHEYLEEKGVDTRLVCTLIEHAIADAFDVAILVSSDSDHIPGVQFVRGRKKRIENAFFPMKPYFRTQSYHASVISPFGSIGHIYPIAFVRDSVVAPLLLPLCQPTTPPSPNNGANIPFGTTSTSFFSKKSATTSLALNLPPMLLTHIARATYS